jgi:hypothetical protein
MLPDKASAGRRHALAVAAAAASALAFLLPAVPSAAAVPSVVPAPAVAGGPGPARAITVSPPPDSHRPQGTGLYTVSCTGTGTCMAGGNYEDKGGSVQPMVVAEAHGRWQRGVRLLLPPGAQQQPYAQVTGVSCGAPGSCAAVGTYSYNPARDVGAFVAAWSHGKWARAQRPPLPVNAATPARARLAAVACRPDGFCEAVGSYTDKAGQIEAMALTKPPGRGWGRATGISAPPRAAASPDAALTGIACTGPGACVAVGHYNVGLTASRGMGAVETGGRWRRATAIPAPPGAVASSFTEFTAVACLPRGPCLGVGAYAISATRDRAMSVTESHGVFGGATPMTAVPPGAARQPSTALSGVSCPPADPCVAIGVATNKAGHYVAMSASRRSGRGQGRSGRGQGRSGRGQGRSGRGQGQAGRGQGWTAVFLAGPANARTGRYQQSSLFSVSCAATGRCAAVGYYNDASAGYSAAAAPLGSR